MASTSTNSASMDEQGAGIPGSSAVSLYALDSNEPVPSSSYRPSPSPSVTSQSDDPDREEDDDEEEEEEDDYTDAGTAAFGLKDRRNTLKARGSAALVPKVNSSENWHMTPANARNAPAATLPHEILLHIFKYVAIVPPDLRRALSVCKSWCLCGVELLWHRPSFHKISSLFKLIHIIRRPDQTFPYANFIRRLNLSLLSNDLEDSLFGRMAACSRLERLTLTGCTGVSDDTIASVLQNTKHLVAADFSEVSQLTDKSVLTIAKNCPRLQGINLTGCKNITSASIAALAKNCRLLRRVKLCGCELIGDEALAALAEHCPVLLEVDLINCPLITDASVRMIWHFSFHMRELRLAQCGKLTDLAFPAPPSMLQSSGGSGYPAVTSLQHSGAAFRGSDSAPTSRGASPMGNFGNATEQAMNLSSSQDHLSTIDTPMHTHLRPSRMFDHLRILDLTNCNTISDTSIEGIVNNVPRIRNLILAKCTRLTNESAYSIARLGKNLHYLHLGHVSNLTDRAVCHLARSCTRLRYIDLACCPQLTDLSVLELAANLPKLRRIGLVRVSNLTDQAIYGLVERYTSLERIHLSYCENISVPAIFWLLERLNKLTHLSLTGVPAFRRTELQSMCRDPPREFNAHQRSAFCVYSGKGVNELRKYLQDVYANEQTAAQFGILTPDVQGVLARMTEHRERRNARYQQQMLQQQQQQMETQQQRVTLPVDTFLSAQGQTRSIAPIASYHHGISLDQAMAAQQQQHRPSFHMPDASAENQSPTVPSSTSMEHEAVTMRLPPLNAFNRADAQEQVSRQAASSGSRSHDAALFERMDEDGVQMDEGTATTNKRRQGDWSDDQLGASQPQSMNSTAPSGSRFAFRGAGSAPPSSVRPTRATMGGGYATGGAVQTLGALPDATLSRYAPPPPQINTNINAPFQPSAGATTLSGQTATTPTSHRNPQTFAALATPPLVASSHEPSGSAAHFNSAHDVFGRFDPGQVTPIASVDPFASMGTTTMRPPSSTSDPANSQRPA